MKIKNIIDSLEALAPPALQESYDNSGLLTGNIDEPVKGILISLDMTEAVVQEAIDKGCNLIVAHHPVVFKGLKRLTGATYIERTMLMAIKNDIALYAIHTNLDSVKHGVNGKLAGLLGLQNLKILAPKEQNLLKLVVFVPGNAEEKVAQALFAAGAGTIGNYKECSYRTSGFGTFRPLPGANPQVGKVGDLEKTEETRLEVLLPAYRQYSVLKALLENHPYEEPAYDIISLENSDRENGAGMVGDLEEELSELEFLKFLKEKLKVPCLKYTALRGKKVRKVAVCGGSGSFLLPKAIKAGADVFVTADFKYHEFFDAENKIIIADVGHYESEVHTKELIYDYLMDNFSNIAVLLANTVTNPISYL